MKTPIYDFLTDYAARAGIRFHMPGHKGRGPLGIEHLDITEVAGADVLSHAAGIIAESEANARALFKTGATLYTTEGSSTAIKARHRRKALPHQRKAHCSRRKMRTSLFFTRGGAVRSFRALFAPRKRHRSLQRRTYGRGDREGFAT